MLESTDEQNVVKYNHLLVSLYKLIMGYKWSPANV